MRFILVSLLALACAEEGAAQPKPNYYAFAGAGTSATTFGRSTALFHLGGGAELVAKEWVRRRRGTRIPRPLVQWVQWSWLVVRQRSIPIPQPH
jgi:hypothetical protein